MFKLKHWSDQPKELKIICFLQIFIGANLFGFLSTFILFLLKYTTLSDGYSIFGILAAMTCIVPLLGGVLADKYFSPVQIIVISFLLQVLGFLLLALLIPNVIIIGALLVVIGIGLGRSAITKWLGGFYTKDQKVLRDHGFQYNYAFLNFGAILGPIFYGLLFSSDLYQVAFFISMTLMIMNTLLIIYLTHTKMTLKMVWLLMVGFALVGCMDMLIHHYALFELLVLVITGMTVIWLIYYVVSQPQQLKGIVIFILLLSFISFLFFIVEYQFGALLPIFIKNCTQIVVYGWKIPAGSYAALLPLSIVIGAVILLPLTTRLSQQGYFKNYMIKSGLGMLFAGLSFFIFTWVAHMSGANIGVSALLILLAYFLLGLGEILIGPMVFSAITALIPKLQIIVFIGILYLFIALGGFVSGAFAKYMVPAHSFAMEYIQAFSILGLACLGCVLIITLLYFLFKNRFNLK